MQSPLALQAVVAVASIAGLVLIGLFAGFAGETGWPFEDHLSKRANVVFWLFLLTFTIATTAAIVSLAVWGW